MEFPPDRWTREERAGLAKMRAKLSEPMSEHPPFPDLIGDRRLLRFLRGRNGNVNEACDQYLGHLKWRKENDVDEIRQDIVYRGFNDPMKFPNGEKLLRLAPQIIIAPVKDRNGNPIVTEQYNFSPKKLFQESSLDEYIVFLIYSLEFRNLVMEHMSHEADIEYLRQFPDARDRKEGWGAMVKNCTIRDLGALKWEHIGPDGRAFIKAALSVGSPNYPESLGKAIMINTPWLFNTLFVFLKQMLDANTLQKFAMLGCDYMENLQKEVTLTSIPKDFGGSYDKYNESYTFDYSRGGPIWYEGCPDLIAGVRTERESQLGEAMSAIASSSEKIVKFVYNSVVGERRSSGTTDDVGASGRLSGSGATSRRQSLERADVGFTISPRQSLRGSISSSSRQSAEPRPSLAASLFAKVPGPGEESQDAAPLPRRISRSLSQIGQKVAEASGEIVRREFVDPLYYVAYTAPVSTLLVAAFIIHVLMKLDITFLRYFIIPLVICMIDMTVGLRF